MAWAHLMPAQQGTLHLLDKAVFVAVALPFSALSGVDDNHDGRLAASELQAHTADIQAQVSQRFRLWDAEHVGQLDFVQVMHEPDERDAASVVGATYFLALMKFNFGMPPQTLRLETDLFGTRATERQLTFKATRGIDMEAVVLTPAHTGHRFFRTPWQAFLDYGVVGVEHILLGADNLLFLLTIIVAGAGWRYWLGVLTSFTVAHSLTLTAALMGWVQAPSTLVEPLIAASIVAMAVLNLWPGIGVTRYRIGIVFACGLLHGLGFASSMADMGLHGSYRVSSILGFNLGIELGQALFLVALLIGGRGLHTVSNAVPLARLTSVMAAGVGTFWLLERLQ